MITLQEAKLWASGITESVPPLENNVYFERGMFNANLAYPNTDFSNQLITRGDYNDYNNGGGSVVFNILYPNEGDGKIRT